MPRTRPLEEGFFVLDPEIRLIPDLKSKLAIAPKSTLLPRVIRILPKTSANCCSKL